MMKNPRSNFCPRTARAIGLAVLLLQGAGLRADVPVPPRVLEPLTPAEAWNVIRLASANVERLIVEKRPLEVATQVSLCSPPLRVLSKASVTPEVQPVLDVLTAKAFRAVNTTAKEGMADNLDGAAAAFQQLKLALGELARGFDPAVVEQEIHHCVAHPDVISTSPGKVCEVCRQPFVVRRIPYSFVYVRQDKPTVRLTLRPDSPLAAGKVCRVVARLETLEGQPVRPADLWVTHARHVHMLVVGPGLADFHDLEPAPTGQDGEYEFSFTPAFGGGYRFRAGVVPAVTGLLEHPVADLACEGPEAPPPAGEETFSTTADGYRFSIALGTGRMGSPKAERLEMLRVHVADAEGRPVTRLEPDRGAFAHFTGFYSDGKTVVQLHPVGGDILREDLRGGPFLSFKFHPPHPGFMRLYCQVKVDGKPVRASFGMRIAE